MTDCLCIRLGDFEDVRFCPIHGPNKSLTPEEHAELVKPDPREAFPESPDEICFECGEELFRAPNGRLYEKSPYGNALRPHCCPAND